MRGLKQRFSLAAAIAAAVLSPNGWAQSAGGTRSLQEVVVTAQKVEQREIDVPVAMTEVQSSALVSQNLVQLTDYYSHVPGLQVGGLPTNANGIAALSLRGITSGGGGNPTLAVMIDGVPFGSTTYSGQPPFPDLDPAVLDRIEVLRGPQGTLYGASSLGGLIDLITRTPDLKRLSAHIDMGPSWVSGGNTGWSGRGSANIPLIGDRVALLVSGGYRNDPEWIDNRHNGEHNVNQAITRSGNAKLLMRLTDDLSITLSALAQHASFQNSSTDSTGVYVCPQCATDPTARMNYIPLYGQDTIDINPTAGFDTFELYSAKILYHMGWADLTSLSAWNHTQWFSTDDVTAIFGFLPPLYGLPGGQVTIDNQNQSSRFTQEVRLSAKGKRFDWLAGFYFNHETENVIQTLDLFTSAGNPAGQPYDGQGPFYYNERALFGDLTYHITPRLDLQVGGRFSWLDEAFYSTTTIIGNASLVFGPTTIVPKTTSSARPVTWLVTPSYHITPNLMAYFRAANGYRPGGPNTGVAGIPKSYAPDKVTSYEAGLKGDVGGSHRLRFDAAVYRIDWNSIQLLDTDPISQFTYFSNGSAARSQGLELSGTWIPWRGLTISPSFTYTDAKLTKNLPLPTALVTPLAGVAGDELPYTSKVAGNLNVEQNFMLTDTVSAYVGADYSYVGARMSDFRTNSPSAPRPRFELPGYGLFELNAGLLWNDSWRLNFYARNLGNVRGVITAGNRNGTAQPVVSFTQPRTIGFDVEYDYGRP